MRNVFHTPLSLDHLTYKSQITSDLISPLSSAVQFSPSVMNISLHLADPWPRCHNYVMSKHKRRCSDGQMGHRLASLLSLLGDGFMASFPGFPLAGAAAVAAVDSKATAAARLIGSSTLDRSSGLGWEGGACSEVGGDVSSCCSLWVWRMRSWTRSSNMASCSSWMAWFRWVFLFCSETKQRQRWD